MARNGLPCTQKVTGPGDCGRHGHQKARTVQPATTQAAAVGRSVAAADPFAPPTTGVPDVHGPEYANAHPDTTINVDRFGITATGTPLPRRLNGPRSHRRLPLAAIDARQSTVTLGGVRHYLDGGTDYEHELAEEAGEADPDHEPPDTPDPILVIAETDGRHTIVDGTHRLVAAVIRGDTHIDTTVIAPPPPAADGVLVPGRWVGDLDDPRRHLTRFFHGTTAALDEGDEILPADHTGRTRAHRLIGHGAMAYATGTEDDGWKWAELAWNNTNGGRPRVYEVQPVGEWLGDDETDAGDQAVMSPHGWQVIRQVEFPPEWDGPDDDWA